MIETVIAIIAAIGGLGGVGSIFYVRSNIRKNKAEADSIIVETAISLVNPLRDEIESLKHTIEEERRNSEALVSRLQTRISHLEGMLHDSEAMRDALKRRLELFEQCSITCNNVVEVINDDC